MPHITFPDGSVRFYEKPLRVSEIAASIGPRLSRCAVVALVDERLVDLSFFVDQDAHLRILRDSDPESLAVIRHSAAHLLAHAVKELYPHAQVTIGPVIDDGFYYDFALDQALTEADLPSIEARMHEIAERDLPIERFVLSRADAVHYFLERGESYKAEIIESIPEGQPISLYRQGEFVDLCRGPHVPRTSFLKVFRLTRVAGAYWRGHSQNAMLQRVYGTAFLKRQDLERHLLFLEEAEKRDHRRLGKKLDLFHWQDESPGMVFWHPKGWVIWQIVESYMRQILSDNGYLEVRTPQLMSKRLWIDSGHWENYADHMFVTASEKREYAIKPMNCPGHVQIFKSRLRSYRDLPLRLSEFGCCHRNEPSGALHGLMRVRGFVQDDAHIFCTEEQIFEEVTAFNRLLLQVYRDFGFNEVAIKLSLRPEKRIGSDLVWDHAEAALRASLKKDGLSWEELPGEGAFYGPKIEFHVKDAIGRSWQCGTLQLDFSLPSRLCAEYVTEHNTRAEPVMLHRAILGSIERFIGILIENYAGFLPLWLSPVQVTLLTVTDRCNDYASRIYDFLRQAGIRVDKDLRHETIGYKIRESSVLRVPYVVVIGDKELSKETLSIRLQSGETLGDMSLPELVHLLTDEIVHRRPRRKPNN